MRIENLKKGDICRNYKELCKVLEIDTKTSSSKIAQMKELDRFLRYERKGHAFIIEEIYKIPKIKVDKRTGDHCIVEHDGFQVNRDKWNLKGVYAIILGKDIYIGSTNAGFRKRFKGHESEDNPIIYTKNMIDKGGKFIILEITKNVGDKDLRKLENKWYEHYSKNTDYNVVNKYAPYVKESCDGIITLSLNKVDFHEVIDILKSIDKIKEIKYNERHLNYEE